MKLTKRWRRTHEQETRRDDYHHHQGHHFVGNSGYFGAAKADSVLNLSSSPPNRRTAVANWLNQNHASGPLSPPTTPPTPLLMEPTMGMGFINSSDCQVVSMDTSSHHHNPYSLAPHHPGVTAHDLHPNYATFSCSLSSSSASSCLSSSTSSSGYVESATNGGDPFSCLYLLASAAVSELERQRSSVGLVSPQA